MVIPRQVISDTLSISGSGSGRSVLGYLGLVKIISFVLFRFKVRLLALAQDSIWFNSSEMVLEDVEGTSR